MGRQPRNLLLFVAVALPIACTTQGGEADLGLGTPPTLRETEPSINPQPEVPVDPGKPVLNPDDPPPTPKSPARLGESEYPDRPQPPPSDGAADASAPEELPQDAGPDGLDGGADAGQ